MVPSSSGGGGAAAVDSLRRVFIGSIPQSTTESEIRAASSRYGVISAFHYAPSARGWALITFSTPEEASSAIEGIHGKMLFSTCVAPVAARIANDKKNENRQRVPSHTDGSNQYPYHSSSSSVASSPSGGPQFTQYGSGGGTPGYSQRHPTGNSGDPSRGMHHQPSVQQHQHNSSSSSATASANGAPHSTGAAAAAGSAINYHQEAPHHQQSIILSLPDGGGIPLPSEWLTYYTADGHAYYFNMLSKQTQWERPIDIIPRPPPFPPHHHQQQHSHSAPAAAVVAAAISSHSPSPTSPPSSYSSPSKSYNASTQNLNEVLGARKYGPAGCNIFVFHIPSEWGHLELYEHFKFHGNVISARVKTDSSNRNLGFGFVSYDSQESTFAAIRAMHGFHVGGKWLKVTLRKGEEHLLPPHLRPSNDKVDGYNTRQPQGPYGGGGGSSSSNDGTPAAAATSSGGGGGEDTVMSDNKESSADNAQPSSSSDDDGGSGGGGSSNETDGHMMLKSALNSDDTVPDAELQYDVSAESALSPSPDQDDGQLKSEESEGRHHHNDDDDDDGPKLDNDEGI